MATPLTMPATGAAKQTFELQRLDYLSPANSGRVDGMQVGAPLWTASYSVGGGGRPGSDEWRAFVARLQGSQRWFYGRDYDRPFPKAYPTGFAGLSRAAGGAFDGSVTWSQSIDGDGNCILQLSGLPAAFDLGLGDYIGFRWNTWRRSLVRCVALPSVVGSGIQTVMVQPPVPMVTPDGAAAHLDNPTCLMKALPSQSPLGDMDRKGAVSGVLTAVQDLQP